METKSSKEQEFIGDILSPTIHIFLLLKNFSTTFINIELKNKNVHTYLFIDFSYLIK